MTIKLSNTENLIGRTYNRLTVLSYAGINRSKNRMWKCRCQCGNEVIVRGATMIKGRPQSCGCLQKETVGAMAKALHLPKQLEMIGKTFGRLTVESLLGFKNYGTFYKCRCVCGNFTEVVGTSLTTNLTTSCGCFNKEMTSLASTTHGLREHPLYTVMAGMIQRCYNPNYPKYADWGGRGIYICEEWRHNFKSFYEWALANNYKVGLTIDRYPDNDGPYAPWNCRWATLEEQARNKRSTRLDEVKVKEIRKDTRPNIEIARDYGISDGHVNDVKNYKIWKDIN